MREPANTLEALPAASAQTPRFHEKREAVMAGAARLFNERGVKGATLSDIAASVGLATNSVTYYYRKKEDLATACFLRAIETFNTLARQAGQAASVAERVQAYCLGHAELLAGIERGTQAPLMQFHDIRALPEAHSATVFAAYTDMFRQVRRLLRGPQTAALSREDLNARTLMLLSVALWLRSWIGRHEAEAYPRIAARVADTLVHGLRGPAARWPVSGPEVHWRLGSGRQGPMEDFLRAATALVNEQGYRGASVDRISARLNVTKGSFYHHNDNKQDLITACFERSFGVLRDALAHMEAPHPALASGWDRCGAAARALVRWQLSADGPLLRASATSALPDAGHRERIRAQMQQLTERLGSTLVDGMVDGSVRVGDPAVAAQGVIAVLNATAELHRWWPAARADTAQQVYLRPVFEGILCPGGGSAPGTG